MRTSRSARRYIRTRFILVCVSVAVVAALEVGFSRPVAVRIGATAGAATGAAYTPGIGMSDMMAAAAALR